MIHLLPPRPSLLSRPEGPSALLQQVDPPRTPVRQRRQGILQGVPETLLRSGLYAGRGWPSF